MLVGTTSVEKSAAIARILEEEEVQHARAERQAPRERGLRRGAGRPQGRDHRLHQHGRPRHRHHARRQPGDAREARVQGAAATTRGRAGRVREARRAVTSGSCKKEHDEVVELGGLHIVGTERHESRRIDNQLRGRAGRQGDPGYEQVLPVARRRPDAHLRGRPREEPDGPHGHARRRAHRAPAGSRRASRTRSARSRSATSTSARTCSSTTT